MFETGRVVPKGQFARWIQQQRKQFAPATKSLPPYARSTTPRPRGEVDDRHRDVSRPAPGLAA